MRWLLVTFVAACSAPPRTALRATPQPPPVPARDLAVAEPAPKKPEPEPEPRVRSGQRWVIEQIQRHPTDVIVVEPRRLDVLGSAESDFWPRCVRGFVAAQPSTARISLTEMFARYITTCDGDHVVLARPLGPDGRERPAQSDLTFAGTLAPGRVEVALRLTLCGESPDTDRIVIVTDGERWTSSRVEVDKDDHGCDVVELPVTRSFAKVVRRIVDARDASVRFEGLQHAHELVIGDDLKRDLVITLDALDTLEITR